MDAQFPRVYKSPTELVGRTPLLRLGNLFPDATVLGKLEFFNPAGSVKDRTALSIVRAAEADGRLKPGGTIIETTGPEIWEDTGGRVDVLVSTVGTGGTITGAGSYLREKNPDLRIYAVEPAEAPVLSGGQFTPHKIQGIIGGNGFPPVLDTALYDEVVTISSDVAIETSRELMRAEGLFAGVSAGANIARIVAGRPEHAGQTIVTFLCDTGERYVSSELFDHARETSE